MFIYFSDNTATTKHVSGDIPEIQPENITPMLVMTVRSDMETERNAQEEVQNKLGISGNEQKNIIQMVTEENDVEVQSSEQNNIQIIVGPNDIEHVTPNPRNKAETKLSSEENEISMDNYSELDKSLTKKGDIRKRKKYLVSKKDRMGFLQKKRIESHELKPPCKCKKNCFVKIIEKKLF